MACQLPSGDVNGISDPAICARHGGTWIPEPSLMTDPDVLQEQMQANIGALTETQDIEQQGLDAFNTRDYINKTGRWVGPGSIFDAQKAQDYTNKMGRWVGKGPDFQAQGERWDNTDDFGRPLTQAQADTDFAGISNFEKERDMGVALQNVIPFNKGMPGIERVGDKWMMRTESGALRPPTEPEMIAFNQYNAGQKIRSLIPFVNTDEEAARIKALGYNPYFQPLIEKEKSRELQKKINLVGSPTLEQRTRQGPLTKEGLFDVLPEVTDKDLVRKGYSPLRKGRQGPLTKEGLFDKSPEVTDKDLVREGYSPLRKGRQGPLTKEGLFDVSPDEVKTAGAKGDIPDNIWERMQTKDYWLKGIEGGAGGWDNRLFRLGEMMAYMGTPLSKRGDSPTKRWQEASKTAAATALDTKKAKMKLAKEEIDNLIKMADVSPAHLAKAVSEYIPDKNWFFNTLDDEQRESMSYQIAVIAQSAMIRAAKEGKYLPPQKALSIASQKVKDPRFMDDEEEE